MKTSYHRHSLFDMGNMLFTAKLEDKVVINDNIHQVIDWDGEMAQKFIGVPTRIEDFTVFELYLEGTINISSNFRDYTLKKNDIFISRVGDIGRFYGMSRDAKFILIFVANSFFNPLSSIKSSKTLQNLLFRGPLHHCTDEQMQDLVNISELIRNQINSDGAYRETVIQSLLNAMLFNIYSLSYAEEEAEKKEAEENAKKNNTRQMEIFNRFIKLIKENYAHHHKAAFYADKLCITPKYMSQIIYKVSGKYFKDYIHEALTTEAMMLLNHGHTIQEICDLLEFTSPSSFGRFFKEATGKTPLEYQAQR